MTTPQTDTNMLVVILSRLLLKTIIIKFILKVNATSIRRKHKRKRKFRRELPELKALFELSALVGKSLNKIEIYYSDHSYKKLFTMDSQKSRRFLVWLERNLIKSSYGHNVRHFKAAHIKGRFLRMCEVNSFLDFV